MFRSFGFCVAVLAVVSAAAHGGTEGTLRLPAVAKDVTFDHQSFLVGGRRVLLLSGGVPYFRLRTPDWPDRLLQTRLAGFNTVETPVPWNLHEPVQGKARFEGNADLGHFLDLCREQKLFVLLRIGPYVNAAVANGGLPAWLGDDPKLRVRSTDAAFLEAVRSWWQRLFAVVLPRQAPAGPVVLIQVEDGYRGQQPAYLARLAQEAEDLGVRVPIAVSTLNPCRDFAGLRVPDNALFLTTELLPEPPVLWGDVPRAFGGLDDILFEGLAKGVVGYNHPLWTAGTNWDPLPASAFPTRFEAGTAGILEGGGLSAVHAACKKANLFARSFESVLAQSATVPSHPFLDQAREAGLVGYARGDGTTTFFFLKRRYGEKPATLTDAATGLQVPVPVSSTMFRHVVTGFPVTDKTRLALSTAQVLVHQRLGGKRLYVVYTPRDTELTMVFRTAEPPAVRVGQAGFTWDDARKQLVLRWRPKEKEPRADFVFAADATVHVVAMDESLVADTWVMPGTGVLVGAPGVGAWTRGPNPEIELRVPPRRTRATVSFYPAGEERSAAKFPGLASASFDDKAGRIDLHMDLNATRPVPALLRQWETATDLAEAAADFDDSAWPVAARPQPLGDAPYGWYRCTFPTARAERQALQCRNVADAVTVWLNGDYVGTSATKRLLDAERNFPQPAAFDLALKEGKNVLAVLVKNWGQTRNTTAYDVPLAKATGWGILDDVLLGGRPLLQWRSREGLGPQGRRLVWAALPETADARPRWYRTTFALGTHTARLAPRVVLKGLSHGSLWINGHFGGLYQQRGYDAGHGTYLPPSWLQSQNELVIFEEAGSSRPERVEMDFDMKGTVIPLKATFGP